MSYKALSVAVLVALSCSVSACLAPVDSEEGVEGIDAREEPIIGGTKATSYPESVLVDLKQGGQVVGVCSGAVIAPKVVLTAGHCVHGFTGWNVKAPYASGQTATSTSGATYDWNNDSEYVDPNQHDVGLVFLSTPINLASYPKLATAAVANGTKVVNIGRILNGVTSFSNLYVSSPISVYPGSNVGYPYDYYSTEVIESGDSGGPVMLSGTHTLVAVNSGGGGGTQVLARVDLLSAWIQQKIAAQSSSPAPAPAPTSCAHGLCVTGGKLTSSCDPCAQKICAADPYCCTTAWDGQCVGEVTSICGKTCN